VLRPSISYAIARRANHGRSEISLGIHLTDQGPSTAVSGNPCETSRNGGLTHPTFAGDEDQLAVEQVQTGG
jgi:hypothetical protein